MQIIARTAAVPNVFKTQALEYGGYRMGEEQKHLRLAGFLELGHDGDAGRLEAIHVHQRVD